MHVQDFDLIEALLSPLLGKLCISVRFVTFAMMMCVRVCVCVPVDDVQSHNSLLSGYIEMPNLQFFVLVEPMKF